MMPIDLRHLTADPSFQPSQNDYFVPIGNTQHVALPHQSLQQVQASATSSSNSSYAFRSITTPSSQRFQARGYVPPPSQLVKIFGKPREDEARSEVQSHFQPAPIHSLWVLQPPPIPQLNVIFMLPLTSVQNCPFTLPIPIDHTVQQLEDIHQQRRERTRATFFRCLDIMHAISNMQNFTEDQHYSRQRSYIGRHFQSIRKCVEAYIGHLEVNLDDMSADERNFVGVAEHLFHVAILRCFVPPDLKDSELHMPVDIERYGPNLTWNEAMSCMKLLAQNQVIVVVGRLKRTVVDNFIQLACEAGIAGQTIKDVLDKLLGFTVTPTAASAGQ